MSTRVSEIQRPVTVEKPWGREEIFALVEGKFCGKLLHVRAGHALSLQYHRVKEEVVSVHRGTALVEVGESPESMASYVLGEGEGVHIAPGRVHRITAISDLVMLEASTTELDDVVRLADDYGREDRGDSVAPEIAARPGGSVPAQRRPSDAPTRSGGSAPGSPR